MFELVDSAPQSAIIKVVGIGGGGGNAVQHMLANHVEGVDFIARCRMRTAASFLFAQCNGFPTQARALAKVSEQEALQC